MKGGGISQSDSSGRRGRAVDGDLHCDDPAPGSLAEQFGLAGVSGYGHPLRNDVLVRNTFKRRGQSLQVQDR